MQVTAPGTYVGQISAVVSQIYHAKSSGKV
jgi:uncharacterized protein (UPF0371 family)